MKHRTLAGLAMVVTLAAMAPAPASAQLGKLKSKLKERVEKKIDDKVDCTLDKYMDRKECQQQNGNAGATAGGGSNGGGSAGGQSKAASLAPGKGAWSNYDFVPGDRILFAEDFTTDRVGNFPKRLELDEGTMEVVEWPEGSGKRWLRTSEAGEFHIELPETLPTRWTMEFEITVPWQNMWFYPGNEPDQSCSKEHQCVIVSGTNVEANNGKGASSSMDPRTYFQGMFAGMDDASEDAFISRPFNVRVQADGKYMKVYLDELRVVNMPNMGPWTGKTLRFYFRDNTINGKPWPPLITNIRINAGGREMYDKLMADGRLAVQGIYFSTGSDVIRPESSGTLTEIAEMLKEHGDLKLQVEGHTDNVGDAAKNKALSEARAAAVVKYLSDNGIAADRLKAVGFGDTKPAAPNDTPENRQKNRRVELVKL